VPDLSSHILYRDENFIAVNKPSGIYAQAISEGRKDDLVSLLCSYLGRESIGVHQRLDRDTSGVVLYSLNKKAAVDLTQQFEHRTISKTYHAVVTGWKNENESTRVEHWLTPLQSDGRVRVHDQAVPTAKRALMQVRQLQRVKHRSVLEIKLISGRTHQIRAQLAYLNAPVCGDTLYEGEPAPRLMLHAQHLKFTGLAGQDITVVAPTSLMFQQWISKSGFDPWNDAELLWDVLQQAVCRRSALTVSDDYSTTAYRIFHGIADGISGLYIDVYGAWLRAIVDAEKVTSHAFATIVQRFFTQGWRGVYLQPRTPHPSDNAEVRLVAGEPAPTPLTVLENGLGYRVLLDRGSSTGLYLDQRSNRQLISKSAQGKRVLNLFAHDCAFSIAAGWGGAVEVVNVDLSAASLRRGNESVQALAVPGTHRFIKEDVLKYLRRLVTRGQRFDIIILDPPTYWTKGQSRFSTERDYALLSSLALSVLSDGGALYASSHDLQLSQNALRAMLHQSARSIDKRILRLRDLNKSEDFPHVPWAPATMKSVCLTLS